MSASYAIRVHNLSKRYKLGGRQPYVMFRDNLLKGAKALISWPKHLGRRNKDNEANTLWALRDLDFEIKPGDSVGIVGSNGAGKSTLLKIFSRVTVPSQGYVHLRGRVGSLLEVGTGFHPELTGIENIYLNGAILGMRKVEIDNKLDEIIAFSEVEKLLQTPVKFYSSGMRVRLAFSVAAHLEPEILLVDEVLAVGDVAFQKKSISRMEQVTRDGRTVLFVSHNMAAIRSLCKSGIFLSQGKLVYSGSADSAVQAYLDSGQKHEQGDSKVIFESNLTIPAQITSIATTNTRGEPSRIFSHENSFHIEIDFLLRENDTRSYLALNIHDQEGMLLLNSLDFEYQNSFANYQKGSYKAIVKIPPVLAPGTYNVSVQMIRKEKNKETLWDAAEEALTFDIIDSGSARSQIGLPWSGKLTNLLDWKIEVTK
ncbi:MAG: ABC transporter ATP-binding protein [Anaerolineales bacterium]|nr:MAG: ABC transporter ATP-binding protein [Anaerolineales bacterium]